MYGKSLDDAFIACVVAAAVAGGTIVAVLFWLVPWLWRLIKPWLHAMTA